MGSAQIRVRDLTGIPHLGEVISGTVVGVQHFGSFVRLYEGIEGLLADEPVRDEPARERALSGSERPRQSRARSRLSSAGAQCAGDFSEAAQHAGDVRLDDGHRVDELALQRDRPQHEGIFREDELASRL